MTTQLDRKAEDAAKVCKPSSLPIVQRLKKRLRSPQGFLLLFALGLAIPIAINWFPLLWNYEQLQLSLDALGPWATLIFLGLHIIATVVGIPGIVLTMVGGVFFGLWWGSLWSLIGATLGAIAAFSLSRYWMHGWFERHCSHLGLLKSLNRMVRDRPFWFMLTIRFAPISPFNLVNFLLGLTHIPLRPYALGTLVGIIPGVIAYTWVGEAGYMALHGSSWLPLAGAGLVLAILSALPLLFNRRTSSSAS